MLDQHRRALLSRTYPVRPGRLAATVRGVQTWRGTDVMSEEEKDQRLAFQVERTARADSIKVPCAECGVWTALPLLYRCYQCGAWLCSTCGAEHWPEAASKREQGAISADAEIVARLESKGRRKTSDASNIFTEEGPES